MNPNFLIYSMFASLNKNSKYCRGNIKFTKFQALEECDKELLKKSLEKMFTLSNI